LSEIARLVDSTNLVPGDIIEINIATLGHFAPCDIALVKGDCIVNESMLTGESLPISKLPLKMDQVQGIKELLEHGGSHQVDKSIIFAGTKIVRARGSQEVDGSNASVASASGAEDTAIGLVIRTGSELSDHLTCNTKILSIQVSIQQKDI
jgi:cation-transporting ATPase 13A3/4/5